VKTLYKQKQGYLSGILLLKSENKNRYVHKLNPLSKDSANARLIYDCHKNITHKKFVFTNDHIEIIYHFQNH